MSSLVRRTIIIFLRFLVSVGILIFLFSRIDIKNLFFIVRGAHLGLLIFAFLIFLSANLLCFFRWRMILKALALKVHFREVLSSFSAGIFFNLILPSTIGGDILRIADLSNRTDKPKEVLSSVILDRLSGYLGLDLVVITAVIFGYPLISDKSVFLVILVFSLLLVFLLFLLFSDFFYTRLNRFLNLRNNRFFSYLNQLHSCIYYFKEKTSVAVKSIFLSILIQISMPLVFFLVGLCLGKTIDLRYIFIFIPVVGVVTLLPISVGGLGLRELGVVYLFSSVGVNRDVSLAVSLINSVFLVAVSGLGGLIYAFTLYPRRIQYH